MKLFFRYVDDKDREQVENVLLVTFKVKGKQTVKYEDGVVEQVEIIRAEGYDREGYFAKDNVLDCEVW